MEINSEDASKLRLEPGQQIHFGRANGSDPTDRTVSRRHVSFQLVNSDDEVRVQFQVLGKNPIWVHYNETDEIKIFRVLENGEMGSGDMFCVSGEKPIWFKLKRLEVNDESRELGLESQLGEGLNVEELDVDSIDVSGIDPVKEFGFVVMGHEFDCYPKKMIRDIKNWDWFIDEPEEEESEDDEVGVSKRKVGGRRKRKKSGGVEDDDDEWTGESDEDKVVLAESSKVVKKPKYSTRSKRSDKPVKAAKIRSNSPQVDDEEDDEGEDEDDSDETLGGFIVDEDSAGEELETDDEEEEEEELEEEDDEEE